VHVKISGLFRVSTEPFPHKDLDGRLMQVIDAFGSRRCLFGTDFPFVQQRPEEYDAYVNNALSSWEKASALTPSQLDDIYFGTAERLFGTF
jgi:predicted TIM-barrel fold metal-dependent hydrolase